MNKIESSQQLLPDVTVLNDLPTDGITCLQYLHKHQHRSEELLVSTSWDGHVRIHNTTSTNRSCVLDYNMNSGPLLSLTTLQSPQFSSSSSTSLVTGGCDGSIRQLDIETSTMTLIGKHVNTNKDVSNSGGTMDSSSQQSSSSSQPVVACSCLASIYPNIVISAGWHQQLHVWDIRMSQSSTSSKTLPQHTISLPGKAFAMDIDPKYHNLIAVATSGRRNCFIDIRYSSDNNNSSSDNHAQVVEDCALIMDRESSLKYQTRCLKFFPDGDSIVVGSIEGRAAVEFLDDLESLRRRPNTTVNVTNNATTSQNTKFAFKCHRINDMVYPVNAVVCHPLYGTFATGGCDGTVGMYHYIYLSLLLSIVCSMYRATYRFFGVLLTCRTHSVHIRIHSILGCHKQEKDYIHCTNLPNIHISIGIQ
jgi:cell cycle arrest protein BUB3